MKMEHMNTITTCTREKKSEQSWRKRHQFCTIAVARMLNLIAVLCETLNYRKNAFYLISKRRKRKMMCTTEQREMEKFEARNISCAYFAHRNYISVPFLFFVLFWEYFLQSSILLLCSISVIWIALNFTLSTRKHAHMCKQHRLWYGCHISRTVCSAFFVSISCKSQHQLSSSLVKTITTQIKNRR